MVRKRAKARTPRKKGHSESPTTVAQMPPPPEIPRHRAGVSGSLTAMTPHELLQWLNQGAKTGMLIVKHGTSEKKIGFVNGVIVLSGSNDPRFFLGGYLMRRGYITAEEHEKAMEIQVQLGIALGRILVMIEAISEDEMLTLLTRKAEEEVAEIFLWPDGQFIFVHQEVPAMEMVPMRLDPARVMLEASRLLDERQRESSEQIAARNAG